jgi:hypothetical protein
MRPLSFQRSAQPNSPYVFSIAEDEALGHTPTSKSQTPLPDFSRASAEQSALSGLEKGQAAAAAARARPKAGASGGRPRGPSATGKSGVGGDVDVLTLDDDDDAFIADDVGGDDDDDGSRL